MTKSLVKLSLSVNEALPLMVVFSQQLDGYEKIIKGPDEKDRVVACLFELGALRLDIVKNANRVKAIVDDFETVKNAIIKRVAPEGKNTITAKDNPAEIKIYVDEITPILERKSEIELVPLSRAALKLDVNPISIGALMMLEAHGLLAD